jgi:hypothetical protein
MSLPAGVISRPPMSSAHSAAGGRLLRQALLSLALALPFLVQVSGQVYGRARQYECRELEVAIQRERDEQQRLRAERAALRSPARLAREAERLGLVPSAPAERTDTP